MKLKQAPKIEELQARRYDILALYPHIKTEFVRGFMMRKLESVNRDLYTLTKNSIYK
jgi:hypothetical protein